MKLYDFPGAPNPRRVKIFAAEKNISLDLINCDMAKREHKTPEFLAKNPSGKIPVLELEDGRCISESIPICRYLESLVPEPNLFGNDAFEISFIESRNRHIELELWTQIGISWVNGPIVGSMGLFQQIPDAKVASDKNVKSYYKRLDNEFSASEYVAGNRYTVADITLLSAIDFASSMVDLKPDESLDNLYRWHNQILERSSSDI
ncbi:MAG: glutathione S-transferase family protein [SAR86 cluster bacterium]|nr:glutathione S-transferase family protein [SAR86 cluster bacterium]|tara:strand:- start:436 stop:1050 length:615 start_codon:yes stop_codon:yes gene_type:complete